MAAADWPKEKVDRLIDKESERYHVKIMIL